jgi:hypothetical protein
MLFTHEKFKEIIMKKFKNETAFTILTFTLLSLLASFSRASETPANPQGFLNARVLTEHESSDHFRLGIGYTFFGNYSQNQEIPSASLSFDFNTSHLLQWIVGVGAISPHFNYGTGLLYRFTASGDRNLGLHVGALVNIGSARTGDFIFRAGPVLGLHIAPFTWDRLQFSFDGGPTYVYNRGSNFQMRSLGGILGLSIHYYL